MAKSKKRGWFNHKQAFIDFCTPSETPPYDLPKLGDIAKKYQMSYKQVEYIAGKYKWSKKREALGERVENAFLEDNVEMAKKEDSAQFSKLSKLEDLIVKKALQYAEEQNTEGLDRKLRSIDIKNITDALVTVQKAKRVILKLATDVTKAEVTNRNLNTEVAQDKLKEMDEFLKENATS